jgi:cytochrome c2
MNKAFALNSLHIAVLAIFAAVVARPALAADASNGGRLAERWCAACHVVSVGQREASSDAPPFAEIAKRPNFSEAALRHFCSTPTPRCRT